LGTVPSPRLRGSANPEGFVWKFSEPQARRVAAQRRTDKLPGFMASSLLRVEVFAMSAVLVMALCVVVQVSGTERQIKDLDASQSRSLANLEGAAAQESIRLNRLTASIDKMNAELAASRREFNGRMDAMESRLRADQRERGALLGGVEQVAQANVMTASR
jgi:uncharacterized protein YlxW (UPF0749 family)